jgi:muramidase (phage lysozyme)
MAVIGNRVHPNVVAFMDTLAYSEGTDDGLQRTANHGYDVLVGGRLFTDYSAHPRIRCEAVNSDAAGRYQFMGRYWDHYKAQLNLPDFGPMSQDLWCLCLLKECKAIKDIEEGRFDVAIAKCKSRWASLPGAGYGQHEHKLAVLTAAYRNRGGITA